MNATIAQPVPQQEAPAFVPASRTASGRPVWSLVLLVYAALMPPEMRLDLGGVVLYPDRAVLYALLPLLLFSIARGTFRFHLLDLAVLGAGAWMIVAITVNYGLGDGIVRGGALGIDFALAYFVGRNAIGSVHDFRRLLVYISPGFFVAGTIVFLESVTGRLYVRPLAETIFGALPLYEGGTVVGVREQRLEIRLGLLRGYAGFPHAILGGTFLCSALVLFAAGRLRGFPKWGGILGAALGFFSLSSTAIMVLVATGGLTVYEFVQRRVRELNWGVFTFAAATIFVLLELLSKGGAINAIIRYLTLNPASGNFRQLIWEFGTASVARNPWFGIGFDSYERPQWMLTDSIDTHWLLAAVRFGLPAAIFLGLAFIGATIAVARASGRVALEDRMTLRSMAFFLIAIILAGFTVAFSGSILGFFIAMAGAAVTLSASPTQSTS